MSARISPLYQSACLPYHLTSHLIYSTHLSPFLPSHQPASMSLISASISLLYKLACPPHIIWPLPSYIPSTSHTTSPSYKPACLPYHLAFHLIYSTHLPYYLPHTSQHCPIISSSVSPSYHVPFILSTMSLISSTMSLI